MASRMRSSMNHADFCVTPSDRASSCDEMLFLLLAMSQTAGSHLSQPNGLSSKMVPTLSENCLRQPLHFQIRRVERNEVPPCPQRGQTTLPSAQRDRNTKLKARSGSEK